MGQSVRVRACTESDKEGHSVRKVARVNTEDTGLRMSGVEEDSDHGGERKGDRERREVRGQVPCCTEEKR